MLSKKMAVSLTSLITIFALAFVVTPAMAGEFEIKITGPTKVDYSEDTATPPARNTDAVQVKLKVSSGQPIADLVYTEGAAATATDDITVAAFDKDGFSVAITADNVLIVDLPMTAPDTATADNPDPPQGYAMKTPKEHQLLVTIASDTITRLVVSIKGGITSTDVTLAAADSKSKAAAVRHTITLTKPADTSNLPKVVSIQRLRPGSQTVVSAFQEERIKPEPFNVRIVLTEAHTADLAKPKDFVEVENGEPSNVVAGTKFAPHPAGAAAGATVVPHPIEGMYMYTNGTAGLEGVPQGTDGFVPLPTGTDEMYRQYRVTITPHQKSADFDIKIKVKNFHDGGDPVRYTYISPGFGESGNIPNGRDILTIPVSGAARNLTAGYKVTIPKDWIIPANGYLVIAQNIAGSEVVNGPDWRTNDTPRATHRTPAQLLYNVIERSDLPNLATEFLNGVVVDVQSQHAGLVVSEVMWGEDVSLDPSSNSQYIELYNPGGQYKTVDDADHTPDVNEALTLIFYRPNEFSDIPAVGADGSLPTGITDRIGTLDTKGAYWSPATKGQSGRSGTTATGTAGERGAFVDSVPIVSMYRVMAADGTIDEMMGQMSANWASSAGPKSTNFDQLAIGIRHGTPGAATDATRTPADDTADAEAEAAKKKAAADAAAAAAEKERTTGTYPMQGDGRVYISEIMFAGGGTLPQWIEIANGDRTKEFNLSGWTLTVDNAAADADVDVSSATFTIPDGTKISPSAQHDTPSTILVVTEKGRNSLDTTGAMASGQVINLAMDNEVELITAGVLKGKYTLLSDMAFLITLAPPVPKATTPPAGETAAAKATRQAAEKKAAAVRKEAVDMAGNLGADGAAAWALPMNEEGARSSIIRKHVQVTRGPAAPEDGMMMGNWTLAANTAFADVTHIRVQSYYGAANDVGTPGFRAGGALPVELSHFRPARDKATGQVVITWSTQSELNNAGFFVKRSNQRNGEFKVINATMIAGAGTTSEKQFYTYTDTTAQPNVVYYYQIEDVSLDGQRQTLTRGIRLKGHVGAAGKATTLWGELKTSHE